MIDKFTEILESAPSSLKCILLSLCDIEQNPVHHPEGNVFIHTKIVTNRLYNTYGDINLTLSGVFHDIGKYEATFYDTFRGKYTSPNHESYSLNYISLFADYIKDCGGDVAMIKYIVSEHMRVKFIETMRTGEQLKIVEHIWFDVLRKFTTADYGGDDEICRERIDFDAILKKVELFKDYKNVSRQISEKFNGNIIMAMYPTLKGKELGDVITKFKKSFKDFQTYALEMDKSKIIEDFNNFMSNEYKEIYSNTMS